MHRERLWLGQELLVENPLMGDVLVDDQQPILVFDEQVGVAVLAEIATQRGGR